MTGSLSDVVVECEDGDGDRGGGDGDGRNVVKVNGSECSNLPIGDNVDILLFDHFVKEFAECPPVHRIS